MNRLIRTRTGAQTALHMQDVSGLKIAFAHRFYPHRKEYVVEKGGTFEWT